MGRRPRFEPDLKKVEALAATGLNQRQICDCLDPPIGESTFYAHKKKNQEFREALKRGQSRGVFVASSALMKAVKEGNITAIIFYLKNRDPDNWLEPERTTASALVPIVNVMVEK